MHSAVEGEPYRTEKDDIAAKICQLVDCEYFLFANLASHDNCSIPIFHSL